MQIDRARAARWPEPAKWLAPAFLVIAFLIGGGSRSDILSLVVLRPLAAIVFVIGAAELTRADIRRQPLLFGVIAASAALALVQLIPLPPALWHVLPGHQIVRDVDAALGQNSVWRPITLTPNGTINALFSLLVPAALLVHMVKLNSAQLRRLITIAIGLGLLSAFIGIAQAAGSGTSALYFYRITNPEFAVGLFSNRNHQGLLLAFLFPMLAAYASFPATRAESAKFRLVMVLLVGVALIPLILITGSRMGAALGLLGIVSCRWIFRAPDASAARRRESQQRNYVPLIVGAVAIVLVVMTALLAQVSVFGRFAQGSDALKDMRFEAWREIADMTWKFFPFGSGLGSFTEVYRVYEPAEELGTRYLNHAHNDWLEVILTGGILGLALLLVAVASLTRSIVGLAGRKKDSYHVAINRMGAVVIVMLGLGSLVDYPLRTPSLACIFILATVCLRHERTSP